MPKTLRMWRGSRRRGCGSGQRLRPNARLAARALRLSGASGTCGLCCWPRYGGECGRDFECACRARATMSAARRGPGDDFAPLLNRGGATLDIPLSRYRSWLDALPADTREAIDAAWGAPEDDPAFSDGSFRIPVIRGRQCARGACSRIAALPQVTRPATTISPARRVMRTWRSTALCAKTLEYSRARASRHARHARMAAGQGAGAVGCLCAAGAARPVPVVYPFIVNNPGEAVQAKRRISAVTIGHLTPPLSDAGLHGPLAELEGPHRGICGSRRR